MMKKIEHITKEQAVAIDSQDPDYWYAVVNGRIDKANEATEQYITAEEARKLGAGKAEYRCRFRGAASSWANWIPCGTKFEPSNSIWEVQYRAIKQPEPVEPHAELKAMYEQQVNDGTLGDFVWEWCFQGGVWNVYTDDKCFKPSFRAGDDYQYCCTPKPTCQVRNLDTGELKTMTREAAKKLQAETMDTCDWFAPNMSKPWYSGIFCFDSGKDSIYTYKLKPVKVEMWCVNGVPIVPVGNDIMRYYVGNFRCNSTVDAQKLRAAIDATVTKGFLK